MKRRHGERKWVSGLSGSIAGSIAEFTTLPMDTVKVRMQINASKGRLSPWDVSRKILSEEGPRGFFKGLSPAIARQVIYQGIKMLIYEPIRDVSMHAFEAKETGTKMDDILMR